MFLLQEIGYRREHVVLLVDTNTAVPREQPKPQRIRIGTDEKEYVMIVQKLNCLAQEVDEARIAANGLEVLQVGGCLPVWPNAVVEPLPASCRSLIKQYLNPHTCQAQIGLQLHDC